MLLLPGECWAYLCVYLDLRSLTALRATSHAIGAALKLAPLDCWVDLRCSAKGQRKVSPAGLRALRFMAGPRLRSVDLHGCTQLSCHLLASSLLLQQTADDSDDVDGLPYEYLGMGDVRLLSPGNATPDPSRGMGHFLQLLAQRCGSLTRLDLSGCRAVDGHAIETLAACMDGGIPQLRWLALDGCASSLAPARRGTKSGSNHPLAPLARHAHRLCELGLGAFLHFDDDALGAVFWRPSVDELLANRVNEDVAAVPLVAVVEAQVRLTAADQASAEAQPVRSMLRVLRLHSSSNLQMTRGRWSRYSLCLPNLVELDLSICPRLGAEVFNSLLEGFPVLRRLNLAGCDTLGDAQVLALFASKAAQSCAAGLLDLNLGEKRPSSLLIAFVFSRVDCARLHVRCAHAQ